MSEKTGIAWTDHTFNPWWGCVKVSPGCANCYAEGEARRRGFEVWGPKARRRGFGADHWKEPLRWNRAAEKEGRRHRVFCASMADVFESLDPPMDGGDLRSYDMENERLHLWAVIEQTPWLDWQLLTKRPENFGRMLPRAWLHNPRPNVWLGVSAEDQARADQRIPILLQTAAAVRFVSAEPLLGPVDLGLYLSRDGLFGIMPGFSDPLPGVNWVIVGGESGAKARPCDLKWIREIVFKGKVAGVPVFLKQLGARPYFAQKASGTSHDLALDIGPGWCFEDQGGATYQCRDRKGGDPAEWPEDLRVQEFPR